MTTINAQFASLSESDEASTATLQQIRTDWSLDANAAILPQHLHVNEQPPDLLAVLLDLSDLTINQPDRAWNLINTYFSARIREASYTGGQQNIYANLQIEDVEKAVESIRKMRKGQELQAQVLVGTFDTTGFEDWQDTTSRRRSEEIDKKMLDAESEGGKRKYSIRNELFDSTPIEDDRASKKPRRDLTIDVKREDEGDGFPSPPPETCLLTPTPTAVSTALQLPPIATIMSAPPSPPPANTPYPHPYYRTPTPNLRSRTATPILRAPKPSRTLPPPLPLITRSVPNLSLQIPPTLLPAHIVLAYRQSYNEFLEAARQATHQANLLRREAEMLEARGRVVRRRWREGMARARGFGREARKVHDEWSRAESVERPR
ncbi:hypothetical protein EK21DRAFT_111977 [Setomelanomma holmii]|uniref:Uncharacterized protein n=1 Tax=Setomelanomma holmii TaxID=210430 RepID=A0A9P4HC97_9PLEO|nr:hypothetical protein EK21DRAFT_111977 [Setomelanomma holmii]